jgi:hypothetical protein
MVEVKSVGFADDAQKPNAEKPPSTAIHCPVMYDAAGVQRNAAKPAISWGSPTRFMGVCARIAANVSGLPNKGSVNGVRITLLCHSRKVIIKARF